MTRRERLLVVYRPHSGNTAALADATAVSLGTS